MTDKAITMLQSSRNSPRTSSSHYNLLQRAFRFQPNNFGKGSIEPPWVRRFEPLYERGERLRLQRGYRIILWRSEA